MNTALRSAERGGENTSIQTKTEDAAAQPEHYSNSPIRLWGLVLWLREQKDNTWTLNRLGDMAHLQVFHLYTQTQKIPESLLRTLWGQTLLSSFLIEGWIRDCEHTRSDRESRVLGVSFKKIYSVPIRIVIFYTNTKKREQFYSSKAWQWKALCESPALPIWGKISDRSFGVRL